MNGTAAPGRFTMSSEAEDLGRLGQWLRGELAGLGVDRSTGAELLLAVGELCANSIEHAYEGRSGQSIDVSVRGYDDRIEIRLHVARAVEGLATVLDLHLEALPKHGMGIHLVRRIADSVSIDVQRERGTHWTLVKPRLSGPSTTGRRSGQERP
jgi:anti-sigma regulatory factor (Ser/Thr protein kinase)